MSVDRPPRDIQPRTFFEEWLPALYAKAPPERRASGLRVRVLLDGDGGGAWDLHVEKDGLRALAPSGGEQPVTLHQSVADWRAVAVGEEGAPNITPPGSPLDLLFLDPALRQVIGTLRGAIRFEVTAFRGRTWALMVKLGDQPAGPTADATITVDADTYGGILAKQLDAPAAFFQGKIKLSGDTGLAMQWAMAALPRFTGR
jgi:hypothetical protein